MNTSLHTLKPAAVLGLALLTACGGGGGGPPPAPDVSGSGLFTFTKAHGQRTNVTVNHTVGNEAATGTIALGIESTTFNYGDGTSLSSYPLDNGTRTYAVDTTAFSTPNLVALSANAGNQQVWVGGTTWTHSRYGFFLDKTPNSNGANSQYLLRNLPYVRYQRYYSASAPNATYNQAGSKAVGSYAITDTQTLTFTCNISVAFTNTGGAASSATFTLSGCDNGITMTGSLGAAKSNADTMSSSSVAGFSATSASGAFTPLSVNFFYGIGGANSEEIVGTALVNGNTSVGGVPRLTQINFAFGAKK